MSRPPSWPRPQTGWLRACHPPDATPDPRDPRLTRAATAHPSALTAQQPIEVLLFPGTGTRVLGETALLGQELGAVETAPPVLTLHFVLTVQHLVKDDPGHEVVGHALLIQRRVDAD